MQFFSWNLHIYDVINQVALPLRRTANFHYDTQSQCPLMALWCCTHSLPSYWIYSVYHYPQKPPPHPICWPHPTPYVDPSPLITISPQKWLLLSNWLLTWHSHLRSPFTTTYLRFWARIAVCPKNEISCLFHAVLLVPSHVVYNFIPFFN